MASSGFSSGPLQVGQISLSAAQEDQPDVVFSFFVQCDKKKARRRKTLAPTPIVDTEVRRCTRGSVKRDGFKPVFQELQQQPKKKKPRCKPLTASLSEESP